MMTDTTIDVNKAAAEIRRIRAAAEALKEMGGTFPALARNTHRILASVKMLELNISDYLSLDADR